MLADDWLYQLWYMPSKRATIEALAKSRDLFAYYVGECDLSYGYQLYRNGQLAREFIVDSPRFNDQVVTTDFGERLVFEPRLLVDDEAIDEKLFEFAANLGIEPFVTHEMLRLYATPHESKLDPNAGIRNF